MIVWMSRGSIWMYGVVVKMLRKLELKDTQYILEWMHDVECKNIYLADMNSKTNEDVKQFIKNAAQPGNSVHYAFVDENDEYLGTVSLKDIDKKSRTAEFAIASRKKARGTGITRKATIEILKIGFEEYQLNKIYLNVFSDNERAVRFYEKIGFIFEGEFREHIIFNNIKHNLKWFGMLRDEFGRNLEGYQNGI